MSETRQLKVVVAGDAKSARQALKILGTGLADVDKKTDKASRGVDRFNERVARAAEHSTFALMGLAAAAAGLGVAFGKALELDAAQAKFAAQLGPEQAEKLGKVAGKLYTGGFGETMADSMESIRKVMTSGLIPEGAADKDIERITGKAMNLAKVFDQDVTQTARAAGQMVRTGLAQNADQAFDMLTAGFRASGDHAGDLLDTVTEYGTQFRKLGLDGTTAMGLISQGLKAGARDTDKVADALKEFSIRAVDGSTLTAQGFKMLGLDAGKMSAQIGKGGESASKGLGTVLEKLRGIEDPVKRSQAAVALFGTQSEDLGDALYALDPGKAVNAIGKVGGAADEMGKSLKESAGAQLERFKRRVETAIVGALVKAIPHVIKFGEWMARNKEWIGPIVAGLGTLAIVLGTLTVAAKIYTAVQAALNIVMMANPIGLIVLALIALVAAVVYAWKNSETFRRIVTGAWNAIKAAVLVVINWLKKAIPAAWAAIVNFTKSYWNFWKGIIVGVLNFVKNFYVGAFNFYKNLITGAWKFIRSATSSAWNAIKNLITSALNAARSVVSRVTGSVRSAISSAWSAVKSLTSSAWNAWVSVIRGAITKAISVVKGVKGRVTGALSGAAGWLRQIGSDIISGLTRGIREGVGRVREAASAVANAIPGPIRKALGIASPSKVTKAFGKWVAEGLADGMTGSVAKVSAAAKKLADGISGKLEKRVAKTVAKLKRIAKEREQVAAKLGKAKEKLADAIALRDDFAKGVRDSALGLANITDEPTTAADMIERMRSAVERTRKFTADLAKLRKMGLNDATYKQLAEAGVESGGAAASALLAGGASAVGQINSLQKQLGAAASTLGSQTSNTLYGAGVDAAKGLVKGLESQAKALERAATKLAKSLVKTLKKALKIKSPSRLLRDEVGVQLPRGVAAGIDMGRPAVDRSLKRMVRPGLAAAALAERSRYAAASGVNVTVHVAGTVTAERDLVRAIAIPVRDEIARNGKRNGGRTGL
ncbi:hypothetical protein GCM10029963_28470 [Micromonospora andamanensis]|uniref:phage tail tape measure protein n=1 Tax=Micromonospora andamanensis TaxID=1287068 RepID=UPI0019521317|nr:phage tail tape measure protein [Micromonospora andamanensis]GIJ38520.1 hypothetical protein Vwe01_18450 [Micromonospora andamanensis]